jgi:hypothetical protein
MDVKTSQTRFHHFQLKIIAGLQESALMEPKPKISRIIQLLMLVNFISRKDLETELLNAKIAAKDTITPIVDFKAKLIKKKNQRMNWEFFWLVVLKTQKQTTAKHILNYFSNKIKKRVSDKIKNNLSVKAIQEKNFHQILKKESLVYLNDSPWSPSTSFGRFFKK